MSAGRRGRSTLCALLALPLCGCLILRSDRAGSLLPEKPLAAIRDGVTPRRELLEALGPPAAVVRPGETWTVPAIGLRIQVQWQNHFALSGFNILELQGGVPVASAKFFEPFGDRGPGGPRVAVYYYEAVEVRGSGYGLALPSSWGGSEILSDPDRTGSVEQLLLLVDEDTGIVLAHVHRRTEPVRCRGGVWRTAPTPEAPLTPLLRCETLASGAAPGGSAGGAP